MNARHVRFGAVAALVALDAAVKVFGSWLPVSSLATIQAPFLWNFLHHLWFILIPLLAMGMLRIPRERYGLTWRREGLYLGLGVAALLALVPLAVSAWTGHLVLEPRIRAHIIETLLFQCMFSAFGEELFYRGFMQGTLNHAFGRPWRIGGTCFGPGLIVVSLLFGIGHLLNTFNPFLGQYELSWGWFLNSWAIGLMFGFARERTGSLVVPVLLHAASNVYPVYMADHPAGHNALAVAWGVAIFILIWWFVAGEKRPRPEPAIPIPVPPGT